MKKRSALIILSFLLLLPSLSSCSSMGLSTVVIDAFDGLAINFDGYNGVGTANISDKAPWKTKALEGLRFDEGIMQEDYAIMDVTRSIEYVFDKSDHLYNGDVITVKAVYDNATVRDYGIEFTGSEKTFTVIGLGATQDLDLFQGIEPHFDGYSPYASVSFSNIDRKRIEGVLISYSVNKSDNLKNGDDLTVTAEVDVDDLREIGFNPLKTSQKYSVALPAMITEISQIKPDTLTWIDQKVTDFFKDYYVTNRKSEDYYFDMMFECAREDGDEELGDKYWDTSSSVDEDLGEATFYSVNLPAELCNMYLLTSKDPYPDGKPFNVIYLVYRLEHVDSVAGSKVVYYYLRFSDLLEQPDGTQSVEIPYPGARYPFNYIRSIKLFFDEEKAYEYRIVPWLDEYNLATM